MPKMVSGGRVAQRSGTSATIRSAPSNMSCSAPTVSMRKADVDVIALLGAVALVTLSVAVTTVAVERPLSVGVVDDEAAIVGFEAHDPVNGSSRPLVTVENRGTETLDRVSVDVDGSAIAIERTPEPIDPGDRGTVLGTVPCDRSEDPVRVDVTVSSEAITVEWSLELAPTCAD